MELLKRIFGRQNDYIEPQIQFGRYSDTYKEEERYVFWDQSLKHFEDKEYLDCVKCFLEYIKDNVQNNVEYEVEEDRITFSFYQGSKKITGIADNEKLKAEAQIAKTNAFNIGFLRRLIELNFTLKYSRYALDEDENITAVFHSYMLDSSPYKMYHGLKELALNADKQDDILVSDFDHLESINMGHIKDVTDVVKEEKYKFLKEQIQDVLSKIDNVRLNLEKYPGAMSYMLLSKVYKLDYLLRPEGKTMEAFEKIHNLFFEEKDKNAHYKNQKMVSHLKKVALRTEEQFHQELYRIKSTFGITAATSHRRLVDFINGELKNMDWYCENDHKEVAMSIPGYIVGYCQFSYALPSLDKELLHLYYQVQEQDFFRALGYDCSFLKDGKIQGSSIKKQIKEIVKKYKNEYRVDALHLGQLKFGDDLSFARSYLEMMAALTIEPIGRS